MIIQCHKLKDRRGEHSKTAPSTQTPLGHRLRLCELGICRGCWPDLGAKVDQSGGCAKALPPMRINVNRNTSQLQEVTKPQNISEKLPAWLQSHQRGLPGERRVKTPSSKNPMMSSASMLPMKRSSHLRRSAAQESPLDAKQLQMLKHHLPKMHEAEEQRRERGSSRRRYSTLKTALHLASSHRRLRKHHHGSERVPQLHGGIEGHPPCQSCLHLYQHPMSQCHPSLNIVRAPHSRT
jgi:hypothetical protein